MEVSLIGCHELLPEWLSGAGSLGAAEAWSHPSWRMSCAPMGSNQACFTSTTTADKLFVTASHNSCFCITHLRARGWCHQEAVAPSQPWSHRSIERPGLKRTTMLILFQPPCYVQGRQPAAQAAQSHIQPGLECMDGFWRPLAPGGHGDQRTKHKACSFHAPKDS